MASENETVAEIAKRVRRECSSLPLPTAATEKLKLAREFQAAHNREIAAKDREIELLGTALKISNGMNDAAASSAVAKDAVITDLCHRLKVAEDALKKLNEIFEMTEYAYGKSIAQPALAAIRGEGGVA